MQRRLRLVEIAIHRVPKQKSVHLLSLYEVQTGTVLAQRAVATKENEISVAPELVTPDLLKGRIYSADAMHTQKKWCRQVIRAGGQYLLIAKANQATLHEDLTLYLEDSEADRTCWRTASICKEGHGRLEKHFLIGIPDLNDSGTRLAGGGPSLFSPSELMTMAILFHRSYYRMFKAYCTEYVQHQLCSKFPTLVSYQRLVGVDAYYLCSPGGLSAYPIWSL